MKSVRIWNLNIIHHIKSKVLLGIDYVPDLRTYQTLYFHNNLLQSMFQSYDLV